MWPNTTSEGGMKVGNFNIKQKGCRPIHNNDEWTRRNDQQSNQTTQERSVPKVIKSKATGLIPITLISVLIALTIGASQASGAFTSKEERRIKNLEATISILQGAVTDMSKQLSTMRSTPSGSNYLDASKYSEIKIPFLTEVGFISSCPTGTGATSLFAKQYPLGQDSNGFAAKMTSCTATFLVKK